jgi:hypothetical protein
LPRAAGIASFSGHPGDQITVVIFDAPKRDLFLVTPGAPHHLLMLMQPDQVQVRKAQLVTPKVAVQDVADNSVQLESQIVVSLVSNASRPHDWIPRSDMVPIMKSVWQEQGIEDVRNVVDNDLKTFYQIPPGENMTFDLLIATISRRSNSSAPW